MDPFQIVAILISLAALLAFNNQRFLHLHPTVGIMLQSLLVSALWLIVQSLWPRGAEISAALEINLHEALFHWMLAGLLFAGAMRVDLSELRNQRSTVAVLALAGTLVSTFTIAAIAFWLCRLARIDVPFISCAIFGAAISPTDPVAVMGFLKAVNAPKEIAAIIGGESLFNDGVGVVLFTVLTRARVGEGLHWINIPAEFLTQTLGGAGIGLLAGLAVFAMIRRVDNYQVEVLLTLALAMGGYTLADALQVSGPIAAVVAGLIIGNHGRKFAVSDKTRMHLDDFWELIDETLNAVLFLLVGLVVLQMHLSWKQPIMQLTAVMVVLLVRWMSVKFCIAAVRLFQTQPHQLELPMTAILTWGGLRGGLALAMALSLPPSAMRDHIVAGVFGVVTFSVLVQGSTLPTLFKRWIPAEQPAG